MNTTLSAGAPAKSFWHTDLPEVRVSTRVSFRGPRRLVVSCLAPSLNPHCKAVDNPVAWGIALRTVKVVVS